MDIRRFRYILHPKSVQLRLRWGEKETEGRPKIVEILSWQGHHIAAYIPEGMATYPYFYTCNDMWSRANWSMLFGCDIGVTSSKNGYLLVPNDDRPHHETMSPPPPPSLVCAYAADANNSNSAAFEKEVAHTGISNGDSVLALPPLVRLSTPSQARILAQLAETRSEAGIALRIGK